MNVTVTLERRWVQVALFMALLGVALIAAHNVPSSIDIGLQKWVRDRYLWTVQNRTSHWLFTRIFNPMSDGIDSAVGGFESFFELLRWPGVVALFGGIAWRTGGMRAAVASTTAVCGVGVLGVWDRAIVTLSLMCTAVVIALLIGIPLGIWTSRSDRAERVLRTFLDTAQVMPIFVYLSIVTVFFGLLNPPAVVATVVYAVPPAVRLTNLGLRSVPVVANEVGQSFGCTSRQQLFKVQLPMARRTILLGLNQVIMMAFAIVVIASVLGAADLGNLVLKGLQKSDVGAAFVPGLAIVLLAVALDRATTGERGSSHRRPLLKLASVPIVTGTKIAAAALAVSVIGARVLGASRFPEALTIDISATINDTVGWVQSNLRHDVPLIGGTQTINDFLVGDVLEPLRRFFVWVPWLVMVLAIGLIAYLSSGWRLAVGCATCMAGIGLLGTIPGGEDGRTHLWDLAMDTLSQVLVAIAISVVIAVPLGIWAGRSDRVQSIMRPFLDFAQVMPQYVYLIPVVILFLPGRGAGVVASVVYAVPPCIRLTSLGLREVAFTPREAAISFGATPRQEMLKVQLPLAFRSIMLGINQTILMVLATVIIAALVGAGALGIVAFEGFSKPLIKIGQSWAGGLSIVLLAIVLDRITQAWGTPEQSQSHS